MTSFDTVRLHAAFAGDSPLTVGIEEELMLLDPGSLDLAPVADEVLACLGDDGRFKPELPAAQLESITEPTRTVAQATAQLAESRAALADVVAGVARPAAAGAHPFASVEGTLNPAPVYRVTREEYGPFARRQLVFGLHVHVRVSGARRAVAVFNALRSYLPELAALAANAPYHGGQDTQMASIRPKISEGLPRQGVPAPVADLDELAGALRWGQAAGVVPDPRRWWWELRLHPVLGTVEVRVADQQTTVGETAAVAGTVHALVADLAARIEAGETLTVHPTWRIAENRWSAARHGLAGTLADLDTGARRPTRERVLELLAGLEATAARLGCREEISAAIRLAHENGAERQRRIAHEPNPDLRALAAWLADQFLAPG